MTHLSSADGSAEADREFTRMQLSAFAEEVPLVRKAFGAAVRAHALNSAGILSYREHVFDMVRPGITLYGSLPAEGAGAGLGLKPGMGRLTGVPGVAVGTDVVVRGEGGATADELARISGTIPYEILTQVGRRIPRRVVD